MTEAREILHQVLGVPGAIGAMAFSGQGAILASDFPEEYTAATLRDMARMLSEDLMVQQALAGDEGGLDLRYTGGRVILRPFSKGAVLALCTVAVNAQLVHLALHQAAHRLDREAGTSPLPPVLPRAAEPARYAALGPLKEAFLEHIGPIGELLFNRIHADWSAGSEARPIGDLAARLAQELDDPGDQKAFLKEARAIIG